MTKAEIAAPLRQIALEMQQLGEAMNKEIVDWNAEIAATGIKVTSSLPVLVRQGWFVGYARAKEWQLCAWGPEGNPMALTSAALEVRAEALRRMDEIVESIRVRGMQLVEGLK